METKEKPTFNIKEAVLMGKTDNGKEFFYCEGYLFVDGNLFWETEEREMR